MEVTQQFVDECYASFGMLTPREQQVATLRAFGRRNKAVAQELGMAVKTVDVRLSKIKDKMECDLSELPLRVLAALGLLRLRDSAACCVAIPESISKG